MSTNPVSIVKWRGTNYELPPPNIVGQHTRLSRSSMKDVFDRACVKGHYDDTIQSDSCDLHHQRKLIRCKEISLEAIHHLCLQTRHKSFTPHELQTDGANADPGGVYGVAIRVRLRDEGKFKSL